MKDFAGTPGTLTGLVLRVSQFVFAAGSIASMATTNSFFDFTAFWYVVFPVFFSVLWRSRVVLILFYLRLLL